MHTHPNEVFLCVFSWLVFLFLFVVCVNVCDARLVESIIAHASFNVSISHFPIISLCFFRADFLSFLHLLLLVSFVRSFVSCTWNVLKNVRKRFGVCIHI